MNMTQRGIFDEVYDSLVNGQFKQAVRIAKNELHTDEMSEMLDYFDQHLQQPEMAIKFAKHYFYSLDYEAWKDV